MIEEPAGFTEDGKLVTAFRWTEAERADVFMANQMYMASPEAKDQMQAWLDSLPSGSMTISGHWDTD